MHLDTELVLEKIEEYRNVRTCSQAILMSFCEVTGLPTENIDRIALGLTGGIGGTFGEGTCGALTSIVLVLGLLCEDQNQIIVKSYKLFNAFKEKYGSVTCGHISKNGEDKLLCVDVCLFAAEKTCELLNEEENIRLI